MLKDYEKYHGTVLHALVAGCHEPLNIGVDDIHGRVNGYVINQRLGVYIKHSSKRLTPWRFAFNAEHLSELTYMSGKYKSLYVVFVCGSDGLACLRYAKLLEIGASSAAPGQLSIGISRSRNQMYGVYGARRSLDKKIAVGVRAILEELDVATTLGTTIEAPAAIVVA